MGRNRRKTSLLNRYLLNRTAILAEGRCKIFRTYDEEWLQFIIANRTRFDVAREFDYVEGGVANDRVVDTVNLYIGIIVQASAQQPNVPKPGRQIS